ncbi:MAG: AraC-like DNA-binding protein [Saprospiraceae bacterium]|jgi:AraC-like DNA-binding protein
MEILPDVLFSTPVQPINVYQYTTDTLISRNKVILSQHVFSFLIRGNKKVDFTETSIEIDNSKALLMPAGNCLMTEETLQYAPYESTLLFFSNQKLEELLLKFQIKPVSISINQSIIPAFVIEKDAFIDVFIQSLRFLKNIKTTIPPSILQGKLEEVILYLWNKYGDNFARFLQKSVQKDVNFSFKSVIESNKYNTLSIEEIAFLCNRSISTFKRHFEKIYDETPGKWFRTQKLNKAKEFIQIQKMPLTEVHHACGYENFSNFSTAYKREFGHSPSELTK